MANKANMKTFEPPIAVAESPLVNAVIRKMKREIRQNDLTAIDELLRFIPRENLMGYLDEEERRIFIP